MRRNYKDARERCGFDIGDAARALGVSVQTLTSYEDGATSPKADLIHDMCKLYGCTATYLLALA